MGSSAKPNRARVGYLTVHSLELRKDPIKLEQAIKDLADEAIARVHDAGLEMIGRPKAIVVQGEAFILDDTTTREELGLGPSVGIFMEIHVEPPTVVRADTKETVVVAETHPNHPQDFNPTVRYDDHFDYPPGH